MKAYHLTPAGGIDSLTIADFPDPTPRPGQVLIRLRAASLNYRDLVIAKGAYGSGVKSPLIPLSDGAGEVVDVGEGSNRFQPGDRVAPAFMPAWITGEYDEQYGASALGGAQDGVLAELAVFGEQSLVRLPEHLSWEESATLPCAAVTSWNALLETGNLRPGQTLLVLGSGGVSVFSLQFARMAGATVIATSSSDAKLDRLRQLGAKELINYKSDTKWGRTVRELTGGVDQVVEVGGAGTLEQSLRATKAGGTISLIGVLAGRGEYETNRILMNAIRLQGIFVGSVAMFEAMVRAIAAGSLRPVIDRVFPFNDASGAYRRLASGSHFGKVVIRFE